MNLHVALITLEGNRLSFSRSQTFTDLPTNCVIRSIEIRDDRGDMIANVPLDLAQGFAAPDPDEYERGYIAGKKYERKRIRRALGL